MASRDANAREHKDYHAMVTHAAYLASVNRGECFHVYFDGEALFVLHSAEEPPAQRNHSLHRPASHFRRRVSAI
jgi:hypothetical protein